MDKLVEEEANAASTVFIFGAYSFTGVSMLSYFAYRGFKSAEQKIRIERQAGQRLTLSKMKSIGGLYKAVIAAGIYLAGFAYFAWRMNLNDRVFQSCIKKDAEYMSKVKLDPFYQDFYILNTMRYFGISDGLMKKTEEELKERIKANEGKEIKQGMLVNFEKSVMALALMIGGQSRLAQTK